MNTRSKRASSVAIVLGFCILAPVAPDGAITAGDRQHVATSYSGILAKVIVVPSITGGVDIQRALATSVRVERALTASAEVSRTVTTSVKIDRTLTASVEVSRTQAFNVEI